MQHTTHNQHSRTLPAADRDRANHETRQEVYGGNDTLARRNKGHGREFCERVLVAQDPGRFVAIIQELIEILEDCENSRRGATVTRMPQRQRPDRLTDAALGYSRPST
jgi:hypothetical protein